MNRLFYISTIAPDAADTARRYGLGIEIAEYCTAVNMDANFPQTDAAVTGKLAHIGKRTFHAPFNELFPCAIDPRARNLAAGRYREAIALARRYGAEKVIIHGGYNPHMYYPVWYKEQSTAFWKEFLRADPNVDIVLENVLEEEPEYLSDIVRAVNHPRLGLCLDIGHANAYSHIPVFTWIECFAPHLRHLHIHNNDGSRDTHGALDAGSIAMRECIAMAHSLAPEATFTLELQENTAVATEWLSENGFIKEEKSL